MNHIAIIGLGSNLGDRLEHLKKAVGLLKADRTVELVAFSSIYETPPIGGPAGQGPFLNAALRLETSLDPLPLLRLLLATEDRIGRKREIHWGPRVIDLDLLLYDDRIIATPELTLPHPHLQERWFVLAPLVEVGGDWVHPILHRTMTDLLSDVAPAGKKWGDASWLEQ